MLRLNLYEWIAAALDGPRQRRARQARRQRRANPPGRRLLGEQLEIRLLLATFSDANPALNLVLGTNQQATIVSTGTTYQLSLSTGTWGGPTGDANVTGNGLSTLTVTSAGIGAFTSGINIADTGSSGGDAVSFSDSEANAYANNFVVTLANSTSGLAFSGAATFAGSSSLTATVSGAIVINSGASVTAAGGAIDLVATGTNAPLTANGNVLTNGGTIALQATGAVTIGTGVTVNSGSGTLTLAADVTAGGSGDDGVGTLSINAGATVTSSNSSPSAITLRGADVNIDTSSNPAVVGAARSLATTAGVTYPSGIDSPNVLAFDSSGNLYVANYNGNTVEKFAPGSTTASATYSSGVSGPLALAFDSSGNLYVANYINSTVERFAAGSTTASATYSNGVSEPYALAIDSSGNLYVANFDNSTVEEFAPGSTTASVTYSNGVSEPDFLAFDSGGNLYVANAGNSTVEKFAPGSTTASATYSGGVSEPGALAIDSSGNLYVINSGSGTVEKFAAGSTTASATYSSGLSAPRSLAIDSSGNLYVANILNETVEKFAVGSTTASATYSSGVFGPDALAFDSNGDLYVANAGNSTVEKFAPGSTTASVTYPGGVSDPDALAFDSSGNLYVDNGDSNTVNKFAPGSTLAGATYSSGILEPDALAIDSSGNLYVVNRLGNTVEEFASGSTTASATYSSGVSGPSALAFDSSGNLYVANAGNNTVEKFAAGSTTVSATYAGGVADPEALAIDSSGNLYVANAGNSTVEKFAPGGTTASVTYSSGVSHPSALAFDSGGNLYVANNGNSTVEKFAPGSTTASATYSSGISNPDALAFDSSGNLYVANNGNSTVEKFVPGSTNASATYVGGVNGPFALAFDSSGNLYVANQGNDTVSEFALLSTPTAGGVTIQSSVESRPMLIGGTNSSPVAGINLTSAELAQIATTAAGTVTIGDTSQTGNITFSTATPATTGGAALNVIQSTAGAGQIILDDASGSGTGLNDAGGTVTLTPGTGGIATTLFATGTPLAISGFAASGKAFSLGLGFAPTLGTQLTVINNTATPAASNLISGTFSNLPQGGTLTTSYLGTSYTFQANYHGGDGNDLVLTDVVTPTQLVVTLQPPATVTAGGSFGLTVTAEDAQGDVATTFSGSVTVNLASNPAGSTLGGTLTVSASGGVAIFSGLNLNKVGSGYTLAVSSGTLAAATSSGISVTPGAATQLLITAQPPATVTAGGGFGFTVTAEDSHGNLATGFTGSETIALASNPGGSTLGGVLTVSATSGVAVFSGLTLNKGGSGYALAVTSGTLAAATSSAISVTLAAATQLVITAQPASTVTAGSGFNFTVTAEDAQGNVATGFSGSETIVLASKPGGGSLGGVLTVTATGGVAVFSGVSLNKAGSGYTLAVSSGTLASATSGAISVTPGAATQLLVTTQPPSTVMAGSGFALSVTAEDAEGNVATGFSGSVTVGLAANPGSSTLGGTLSVNAVAGVASFSGLTLNMPSTGYTLQLTANGLTSATSSAIDVPPVLMITGTSNSNDDVSVTFTGSGQFSVTSGGTTTTYSTTNFDQVMYNAPTDGTFSKFVFDDPGDPLTANQSLGTTTISEGGFQFQAKGVANLFLYGGAGSSATVDVDNGGASSSNFFVVDTKDDYSYIADPGTGAYSELSGFGSETVTGSAGTTYAYIYSTSNAKTVASPTQTTFTVGSVTSTLSNFPQVYVVGAADGTDSVTLDSSGGTFVGTPSFSYVGGTSNGSNFLLGALYAANVTAQASSSGKDAAVFYSYPNDVFTGAPGTSSLAGSTTNVEGSNVNFVAQATGFNSVSIFQSGAGSDVADLTSPGHGSFFGTSTASTLSVGTSTITVNTYFVSSGQTVAVPGQIVVTGNHDGTDSATIYDAPGNNALSASGSTATLTTALGSLTINKFGSVTANKENGTSDTVHEGAIDFALKTVGNWTSD